MPHRSNKISKTQRQGISSHSNRRWFSFSLSLLLILLLLHHEASVLVAASTSSSLLRLQKATCASVATKSSRRPLQARLFQSRRNRAASETVLQQAATTLNRASSSTTTNSATTASRKVAFAGPSRTRTTTTRHYSFLSTSTGTAAATASSTGFRTFSQRATRLQLQKLQKSFSLRAIFGNVVTNNPSDSNTGKEGRSSLPLPPPHPLVSTIATLAVGTALESLGGFLGGYLIGSTTDATRRLSREIQRTFFVPPLPNVVGRTTAVAALLPYHHITQLSYHALQVHGIGMKWAVEWAKISAVFGACRVLVKMTRQQHGGLAWQEPPQPPICCDSVLLNTNNIDDDEDDAWNSITGSALAGAILAGLPKQRHKILAHPVTMMRASLLYGGTMFLIHPNVWQQGLEAVMLTPLPVMTREHDDNNNISPFVSGDGSSSSSSSWDSIMASIE